MSRRQWLEVCGAALLALLVRAAWTSGLELYSDEAYYWLWSRRLALSYFDHPPLVAWVIAFTTRIFDGEAGVRLGAWMAAAGTAVAAGILGRSLSPHPRVPGLSALLTATAPLLIFTGGQALPDAWLELGYTVAAAAFCWLGRSTKAEEPRLWLIAGGGAGMALLSKYTAGVLIPAVLVCICFDAPLRRSFKRPWPYLGAGVGLLIFLPCLIWNFWHHWISFAFQLHHGFKVQGNSWNEFLGYLLAQLVGPGPLTAVLGGVWLVRHREVPARRLAVLVALPLAIITYSAFRRSVEANWPALVYPSLCAAGAAALMSWHRIQLRVWAISAQSVLVLLAIAWLSSEVHHPRFVPSHGTALQRWNGWRQAAEQVRAETGASAFFYADSYQFLAELAFYGGYTRFGPTLGRPSQFMIWNESPAPNQTVWLIQWERVSPWAGSIELGLHQKETVVLQQTLAGQPLRELALTRFSRN